MTPKPEHPERDELIKAAESGSVPFKDHLEDCMDCRKLFEFFQVFLRAAPGGLLEPSEEAMARHVAIPISEGSRHAVKKLKGSIAYDSWAQVPALALRDAGKGAERRLRLEAGNLILEFSAERQGDTWDFTARAYHNEQAVSSGYILKADRREVIAGEQNCFFWSSQQPPRKLQLVSPDIAVDFGFLKWK